jgi:hypothetical protein
MALPVGGDRSGSFRPTPSFSCNRISLFLKSSRNRTSRHSQLSKAGRSFQRLDGGADLSEGGIF